MLELLLIGAFMGAVGTAAMDAWALLLSRTAGIALPNWSNVGRWFWHLRTGTVFHRNFAAAAPHRHELLFGWLVHYAVGVIYGAAFVLMAGQAWLDDPTFLPAWIFGIVTVGAGWFLLQPGMGLGWAASKTPNPWKVRGLNLAAHTVFALGLWLQALALA